MQNNKMQTNNEMNNEMNTEIVAVNPTIKIKKQTKPKAPAKPRASSKSSKTVAVAEPVIVPETVAEETFDEPNIAVTEATFDEPVTVLSATEFYIEEDIVEEKDPNIAEAEKLNISVEVYLIYVNVKLEFPDETEDDLITMAKGEYRRQQMVNKKREKEETENRIKCCEQWRSIRLTQLQQQADNILADIAKVKSMTIEEISATELPARTAKVARPKAEPKADGVKSTSKVVAVEKRDESKIFNNGEKIYHQIKKVIGLDYKANFEGLNVWSATYDLQNNKFVMRVTESIVATERFVKTKTAKKAGIHIGDNIIGKDLEFEGVNAFATAHNAIYRPNDPSSCESPWKGGNVRLERTDEKGNRFTSIFDLPVIR